MASSAPVGVSAAFLIQFSKRVSPDDTTTDVCAKYVMPDTKAKQCSYIDLITDEKAQDGRPFLGPATVFVSHAWKYKFVDVVDVMLAHAEKEPTTYFWFDLFINNQNAASSLPQEWWSTTFKTCIQAIGTVLLVMCPWNDPIPLTRAWCLWEIMCAIDLNVRLLIKLPRAEETKFLLGLADNFEVVLNTLITIRAERAEAFLPKDREMIFETIERTVTFPALNQHVKKHLRQWFLQTAIDLVATLEQQDKNNDAGFATLCSRIGNLLHTTFAMHEEALKYHDKALTIRSQVLGTDHADFAASLSHMALVFKALGDLDKTVRLFEKSLAILIKLEQKEKNPDPEIALQQSVDLATCYSNLGNAYAAMGNFQKAINNLEKGLGLFLRLKGEVSEDTSKSFGSLGMVYQSKGELDNALKFYNKCLEVQLKILHPQHPLIGITYDNLGSVYLAQKNLSKAKELFEKCLACRVEAYDALHPDLANSYNNVAIVLVAQQQYDEALPILAQSLQITLNAFGEHHPSVALIRHNIARAYAGQEKFDEAIAQHHLAISIQAKVLPENHPDHGAGVAALAAAYVGKQDIASAYREFLKSVELTRKAYGDKHPRTLEVISRAELCRRELEVQQGGGSKLPSETVSTTSAPPEIVPPMTVANTTGVTHTSTSTTIATNTKIEGNKSNDNNNSDIVIPTTSTTATNNALHSTTSTITTTTRSIEASTTAATKAPSIASPTTTSDATTTTNVTATTTPASSPPMTATSPSSNETDPRSNVPSKTPVPLAASGRNTYHSSYAIGELPAMPKDAPEEHDKRATSCCVLS